MQKIELNKNWRMIEAPLEWTGKDLGRVEAKKEGCYDCDLPVDVRMPLIEAGVIRDPVIGDACFESEWIEERSWWFKKTFSVDEKSLGSDLVELVMHKLDSRAEIFLNDIHIGSHYSIHYPFVRNVKDELVAGENVLVVRMTSGLEEISDQDLSELNWATCTEYDNGGTRRGDKRRAFVRRPQYTVGWDWGPKIITCGIGEVFLQNYEQLAIREANLVTESIGNPAIVKAMVNVEGLNMIASSSVNLSVKLSRNGKECASAELKNATMVSGYNYFDLMMEVAEPELWWPAGSGDQPLYDVQILASSKGKTDEFPAFRFGLRKLELNTEEIQGEERRFQVVVNDVPIFSQGGNWVPADMIHARVDEAKIRRLLEEAVEANFNAMRIWGGATYEQDCFYEICDELGILIYHDFMLACSTVPDHHQWFQDEMRREIDFQTKRLRKHASLAIFFGSNENHWLFNHIDNPRWGVEFKHEKAYGMYVANIMAPEIIRANCPSIPYWNSSPYGGELPNSDAAGDVHAWRDPGYMSDDQTLRLEAKDYDTIRAKFVSEYGFIGPCSLKTIKEYMGTDEIDREGDVWQLHNNVFEKDTVAAGIEKNYGIDAGQSMSLEDYILYGGMVHGLMFGYSLEAHRFRNECGGALIWMYNDAWGEQGWTIVDYYTRKKVPFYAVKRALAHQKITMRVRNGELVVQGVNDTAEEISFAAEFGYISFDGKLRKTEMIDVKIPAHSRDYLFTTALPEEDYSKGSVMLLPENNAVAPVCLRTADIRDLSFEKAQVSTVAKRQDGEDCWISLRSETYAHGVYVKGDYECSDNYFDLLPGQDYEICIKNIGEKEIELGSLR